MNDEQHPLELYIFPNRVDAMAAGFRNHRHVEYRWMRSWVLGDDPDAIRGLQLARVVLLPDVRSTALGTNRAGDLNRALDNTRFQLRLAPMIWMEL